MKRILKKFDKLKKPQDLYPTFTDTNEPTTSTITTADPMPESVLASAATAEVVQAASAAVSVKPIQLDG